MLYALFHNMPKKKLKLKKKEKKNLNKLFSFIYLFIIHIGETGTFMKEHW
jgi:hypothetical protein